MNTKEFLAEFERISIELLSTVRAKNADYAGAVDPFKNFRTCELMGICSTERGMVTRMLDKISRVANCIEKNPDVTREAVQDTLTDLAAYSIILAIYLDQKHKDLRESSNVYIKSSRPKEVAKFMRDWDKASPKERILLTPDSIDHHAGRPI